MGLTEGNKDIMKIKNRRKFIFKKRLFLSNLFDRLPFKKMNIRKTNRHKILVTSASLLVLLLILPILFNIKISADATYFTKVQTTWDGGIGTSVVNQYSEIDGLDSTTVGEINFGGSPTANETGSLVSNVFDMGNKAFFGNVSFSVLGDGTARIQIRSDSNADMSEAPAWSECNSINTNVNIYTSSCVARTERYLQYKITLTNDVNPDDFSVTDITLQYNNDISGPYYQIPTLAQLSSKVRNTPADTYTWTHRPGTGWGWLDDGAGVAGMKYCISDALEHDGDPFDNCDSDLHPENYVGPAGNTEVGTPEYIADVYPIDANRLTTNIEDPRYAPYIDQIFSLGMFIVRVKAIDNVGNFEGGSNFYISKFTTIPSGPSQDVIPTNTVPGTNMFSFSWSHPDITDNLMYQLWAGELEPGDPALIEVGNMISVFEGSRDEMAYCYAINKSPNPEDDDYDPDWLDNCTHTEKGATSLPADNYGLHQGVNTLYMASINEPGNLLPFLYIPITDDNDEPVLDENGDPTYFPAINYSKTEFTVETFAPDLPRNVEVVDISNRTTEVWRVVLSWIEPEDDLVPAVKYKIYRSTDGTTWGESIGDTNSLSYVDTDPTLDNETTYYYQIKACDNADSCSAGVDAINIASPGRTPGIKPDGHYTSPADLTSAPTAENIGTRKATINWQTNRESDSKIFTSTSTGVSTSGDYSAGNTAQSFSHSVNLLNLTPNTTYYYKVTWTDVDNNTGTSSEMSFTTLPAPSFSEVGFTNITISGSTINFTVENANNVNIYYGKTEAFGGAKTINTASTKSTYSINLTELDDDSKYFIKLNGFDADGNEYQGNIYSFTTLPRPRISNLRFQPVTDASSNTTIVSWTTNVPTSSELSYGVVGSDQQEAIESKLVLEHEITISNLIDDRSYSLIARSRDASGNLAVSDVQTFKTALDTRPPKISNITVETTIKGSGSEAKGQVIVSWDTDEPSTSQVAYGQGSPGSYSNKTSEDSELVTSHTVVISDLSTSSIYQIQPISKDKADNEADGTNQSAIIGRGSEDVLTIIFNALRNIFGIKA